MKTKNDYTVQYKAIYGSKFKRLTIDKNGFIIVYLKKPTALGLLRIKHNA